MTKRVTLKFTGEMWSRAGIGSTQLVIEGATLVDLLHVVFRRFDVRDLTLDENDQFVFRSGILINGRSAKFIGGMAAPIHDGDEVILMRPSLGAM